MAGQRRETRRQVERVVPSIERGTSRVSQSPGRLGTHSGKYDRVELQSSASSRRRPQSPRDRSNAGARRGTSPSRSASPARDPDPKDTQFIRWAGNKWTSMERHQQQLFLGLVLLLLSLVLFGSLTLFRNEPILSGVNTFFLTFFGWASYPLALGLVAFAVAHLIEGIRQQRVVRWSTVIGLSAILLLFLVESRLFTGHLAVGVLAELLVTPLLGWSPGAAHIIVLGLLLIIIIITFRITFGHILLVADFFRRLITDSDPLHRHKSDDLSQYQGQRPQFSRYSSVRTPMPQAEREDEDALPQQVQPRRRMISDNQATVQVDNYDDDDGIIEFEPDFDDDPNNDINLHKHQIGLVRRGTRTPRPIDPVEHEDAVRDARQQALPFNDAIESPPHMVLKSPDLEPLAPNPKKPVARVKTRSAMPEPPVMASPWQLPDTSLLHSPDAVKLQMMGDDTATLARTIQDTLRSFRVDAEVRENDISIGPTVIRFGIRPTGKPEMRVDEKTGKMVPLTDAGGNIVYETRTRVSRIMALQNDLALVLEAKSIRMEAPVPGRPYVGVEIPNKNSRLVTLREVLESKEYLAAKNKSKLAMALGRDVAGLVRVGDLAKMPHLLIAGATGAGKSVMINAIIASFLTQATPDDVRMLMVDPKMVELNMYNGIPHLLAPVVTEVDKVVPLLKNAITEMERRYRLFSQLGVRNLDGYRKMRREKIALGDNSLNNLPAIVIIIDELADLMMAAPEEVEGMICRLAQLARATGIHLVIATQRPSVDVITGLIKANIPTRISFMVSSAVDSRTIIDMGGAERLLGRGDMLYLPADAGRPERIQAAFVADDEAEALTNFWQQQVVDFMSATVKDDGSKPEAAVYPAIEPGWELDNDAVDEFELDDDLLDKAEEVVREYGRASISLLQRRLRIGYSRAARLIDLLEEHGIIGQAEGSRGREVFDEGRTGNGYGRGRDGEGNSLSSVADEIIEEERARSEFLRRQAAKQFSNNEDFEDE